MVHALIEISLVFTCFHWNEWDEGLNLTQHYEKRCSSTRAGLELCGWLVVVAVCNNKAKSRKTSMSKLAP